MLNFFPNPYPDEWFYSLLCRYHIRSGNQHFQSTIKELGIGTNNVGSIYPNNAIAKLIQNLPNGFLDAEDLILNHTLFSYYTRFYFLSEKQEMLKKLCEGKGLTLTHIWKASNKENWRLRYCPICAQNDRQAYGEAYWHRLHQVPILTHCPDHHCLLILLEDASIRKLNERFFVVPIELASVVDVEENLLSVLAKDYVTLPLEVAPTEGYNNLMTGLLNEGYGMLRSNGQATLGACELLEELSQNFGETHISAFTLSRIKSWGIKCPEPYLFLQALIKMSTETMFGEEIIEIALKIKMERLSESNVIMGKSKVAKQLGVGTSQLDGLAKLFGITPFWTQNTREKRDDYIKIYLNPEEREAIKTASDKMGFRYESHFVKFCIAEKLCIAERLCIAEILKEDDK